MTDTLREKIAALLIKPPRDDCDRQYNVGIRDVLAILDAQPAPELCDVCGGHGMAGHPDSGAVCYRCNGTGAAQPAPVDVSEAGPCCHQPTVALADDSQQPASAHIAAAACTCGDCGGLVCCQNCGTPPSPAPNAVAEARDYRRCLHCGTQTLVKFEPCWRCGLWHSTLAKGSRT